MYFALFSSSISGFKILIAKNKKIFARQELIKLAKIFCEWTFNKRFVTTSNKFILAKIF